MGVVTSVPAPVKIQIQDIHATKFEYVLDSNQFENNYKYINKACSELSKNKKIQKLVLKLFFKEILKEDLTKAIEKLLISKGTLIIYGTNLNFFNHSKWTKIWNSAMVTNLQIKFELFSIGFDYMLQGLSSNKSIRILGFRYLSDFQLPRLAEFFLTNTSVYHLQIILENRVYTVENVEEGIHSSKMPSTPQIDIPLAFLSMSKYVTTYTIGGYQDRAGFILGIIQNQSIKTLILENIDVDKSLRHD